ncbi:MAG: hypothetical protein LC733_13210 [Actinobacteria bacterium]|nr:hypothetical protein [Actinomycetota bacterium]
MARQAGMNPGCGAHSSPQRLASAGGDLCFRATEAATGEEVWRSDGTAAGTVLVADINPGALSSATTVPDEGAGAGATPSSAGPAENPDQAAAAARLVDDEDSSSAAWLVFLALGGLAAGLGTLFFIGRRKAARSTP